MDNFSVISENLEKESAEIKNLTTTYTHHLEYWFGLIGSHRAYPTQLSGVKTITFLVPLVEDDARSGGFRTLLRMIGYMQKNNYFINIEVCAGGVDTTEEEQNEE